MVILFIWPQEMFSLCSGEVTLSTYHFMALETVLTRVVDVLGSCSISVFVCPFVALAHIYIYIHVCIRWFSGLRRARHVASSTSLYRSSIHVSV